MSYSALKPVSYTHLDVYKRQVIQIRAAAGSAEPSDIVIPSIIAGAAATAGSIAVCKACERRRRERL